MRLTVLDLADEGDDVSDAYITLVIHAGIAAADVICCASLGVHASGENHAAAVDLLGRVDKAAAKDLGTLLGMKTRSGYSALATPHAERKKVGRAAARLMEAMDAVPRP